MSGFDEASYSALPSPPLDSVSCLRFSPTNPDHLLVSAWDSTVRLYNTSDENGSQPDMKTKFEHRAAVLACSFSQDGQRAYSGGLDACVRELDLNSEKMTVLGSHEDSVSSMTCVSGNHSLITGSWDRTLRFFDPRASTPQQSSHSTPDRIYAIDHINNTLVVAMASRLFHIYDIRKMDAPAQQRESSLKYMTRSLACMPDGQGYATASVEGRIAVEYFDPSPAAQEKKYAFKCHRVTDPATGVDHVYPVNSLSFHPVYNTFASAGSDSTVSIWDHKVKKRLRQYPKLPGPVAGVAFSCDGRKLAVGVSYTWDEGEEGMRRDGVVPWVGVRKVGDEVKPKSWSG
ncbi:hypothetical protein CVT24_003666 [Panaeolus cyanescens]|uniref:Uncharacterized protein n=1 Tax=Panaeolus cyanescens TaxID=181874 RepID=A0A409W8E6_9AGAR|nr:hypothetical protein CVT24_003666 [Panaeolus cyanescens]